MVKRGKKTEFGIQKAVNVLFWINTVSVITPGSSVKTTMAAKFYTS